MKVRADRIWKLPFVLAGALVAFAALPGFANDSAEDSPASDWLYCRGPTFNNASQATGLIDRWNPRGGPGGNVAWRRDDLGGRSTPVVMNGKLYLLSLADGGTDREGERVVCLDAISGETIWERKFNVYHSDVPDSRVGWSAVVCDAETDRVYALGVCGQFQCLRADNGQLVWEIPLHEQFGLISTYGGRTNFPIVFEDLVIVSAVTTGWGVTAKPAHRFLAFDKRSGEVVWIRGTRQPPYDTTYSAPAIAKIGGQLTLVFGSGDGAVWGLQPHTGVPIWNFQLSRRGLNAAPLVVGDRVFIGHSEENSVGAQMGAFAAIDVGSRTGDLPPEAERWRVMELMAGRTAPLLINDRVWVFDDLGKLHILDANSGAAVGGRISIGTSMRSNPLYADGKVYAFSTSGRYSILRPDDAAGAKVISRGRIRGAEVLGSPICASNRIYVPTTAGLFCLFDESKQSSTSSSAPQGSPQEPQQTLTDTAAAHLQLIPAEALLTPGATQPLRARVFNANGQLLRTVRAEWEVVGGGGEVDSLGRLTVSQDPTHRRVVVRASADGLTAEARFRVTPNLPWRFDFNTAANVEEPASSGAALAQPPITWIGARGRHVIRDVDGERVMVKVTTIPKGTRSRSWMGPSTLHDYTIQADVRAASADGKMPDIGLIAQGYTLDLQGASQQLQIRTWVTQQRMAKSIAYAWRPGLWYRLKFEASRAGDKAVLRGKVWPRDEPEPEAWTLVASDNAPNQSGSPGWFGNANDAEIFFDNIEVTKNKAADLGSLDQ